MDLSKIAANSYRNFHARGLDYLCIKRSPELTVKVYFFDGPESQLSRLPEIVAPHDHRYNFDTEVLTGRVANILYAEALGVGIPYQKFEWDTPLNGGRGFTHVGEARLRERSFRTFATGSKWASDHGDIHTLRVQQQSTVIMLKQYADVIPVGVPTSTFALGDPAAMTTAGLYDRMTEAEVFELLTKLEVVAPQHDWLRMMGEDL